MILLKLSDVSHTYTLGCTEVKALQDINLEFKEGEIVALTGPSGSGKTTMINLIGGLDKPKNGSIFFKDRDITKFSKKDMVLYRRYNVSFVFQFFNLLPTLNVYENIEFPLLFRKEIKWDMRKKIVEILEAIGLNENYLFRKIDELSGGERQRVAIGRAVLANSALILADEPTANLDGVNGEMVIHLLRQMRENFKTTVIYSTHDPRVISKADRVIRLVDGRISSIEG